MAKTKTGKPKTKRVYTKRSPRFLNAAVKHASGMTIQQLLSKKF